MKCISQFFDSVNSIARQVDRSTRRKRRLRREHLMGAFHVARIIANGVAAVAPKALPVAVVLNGLNEATTARESSAANSASD